MPVDSRSHRTTLRIQTQINWQSSAIFPLPFAVLMGQDSDRPADTEYERPACRAPRRGPSSPPLATGSAAFKPSPNGSGAPAAISTEIPRAFGPEAREGAESAGGDAVARAQRATKKRAAGPNRSLSRQHGVRAQGSATASAPLNTVQADSVNRAGPRVASSFDGINHRDQRLTNGGNQFSLEPPDQAL